MYDDKIKQAKQQYQNNNLKAAIDLYEEAFQEKILLDDLMDLGLLYYEAKDFRKAREAFEAIISFNPRYARAYYGLAIIAEEFNDFEEAIRLYKTALSYDEKFDSAYFNIAGIYDEAGEDE